MERDRYSWQFAQRLNALLLHSRGKNKVAKLQSPGKAGFPKQQAASILPYPISKAETKTAATK